MNKTTITKRFNNRAEGSKQDSRQGSILLELLLALAIFALISSATVVLILSAQFSLVRAQQEIKALALAQEAVEVSRILRAESFAALANGDHGLVLANQNWRLQGTTDEQAGFVRQLHIEDYQRGGTPDPETKLLTARVTWSSIFGGGQQLELSFLLTNWSA